MIGEVICSSKVLTAKSFSWFSKPLPSLPHPLLIFLLLSAVLWLEPPPGGNVCWMESEPWEQFCFILFLSLLWNLQGENPNLCQLQGGATWKGVRNNEMGNQILSGFQSTSKLQSEIRPGLFPPRSIWLWAVQATGRFYARPSLEAPARGMNWGRFSTPSKSSPVIIVWFMSFCSKIREHWLLMMPCNAGKQWLQNFWLIILFRPPSCYKKDTGGWIQMD